MFSSVNRNSYENRPTFDDKSYKRYIFRSGNLGFPDRGQISEKTAPLTHAANQIAGKPKIPPAHAANQITGITKIPPAHDK